MSRRTLSILPLLCSESSTHTPIQITGGVIFSGWRRPGHVRVGMRRDWRTKYCLIRTADRAGGRRAGGGTTCDVDR